MKAHEWIRAFEDNRGTFTEPDWEGPCLLPEAQRRELARSLAIFQLGETGEGRTLRRYVRKLASEESMRGYDRALELFVAEEAHHAALLAKALPRIGGILLERQWSNGCFRWLRHLVNIEFSVQVLVTVEILALAYYAELRRHCGDEVLRPVFGRLVRDEVRHITFHREFLGERLAPVGFAGRLLWSVQFRVLMEGIRWVLWFGHGRCLRSLGTRRRDFFAGTRRTLEWFLAGTARRRENGSPEALAAGGVES